MKETFEDIFEYLDFRQFLMAVYQRRKEKSKRYSYEDFTEECGFPRNIYIYLVINGTRNLTVDSAKKIARSLPLRKLNRKYFLALVQYANSNTADEYQNAFNEILQLRAAVLGPEEDNRTLRYLSKWYHCVIRELVEFKEFKADPEWIAENLNPAISKNQAKESLELLKELDYISQDADGTWKITGEKLKIDGSIANLAATNFHRQMINAASDKLLQNFSEDRDISGLTLTVSEEEFQKIKEYLTELRKKIVADFGSSQEKKERVAQLNLQLISFYKSKED